MSNTCGCVIGAGPPLLKGGDVNLVIIYCPMHAAADDMKTALREIEHDSWQMREYIACEVCQHGNATDRDWLLGIRSKATGALEPLRLVGDGVTQGHKYD